MDSQLADIQRSVEERIEELERMEALEERLKTTGKLSSSGTYELGSQTELTEEDKSIVQRSDAIRQLLLPGTSDTPAARLSAGGGDGYSPPVGWDQGWVLTTLALSNQTTLNLVDLQKAGAGVDAIIGALSTAAGAVPLVVCAGIAAGLMVISSSVLAIRNRNGGNHGVYWKFTYLELLGGGLVIAVHSQIYFARYK